MARIALMVGLAVAGAVISVMTGGLGTFAVGAWTADIVAGAGVGAAVGSLAGGLLFPGHMYSYGARLNDLQTSSAANGMDYPWGYGGFRIGAQIIWCPGLKETTTNTNTSAKGGPTNSQVTYTYTVSFAAAFCQGPAKVTRVWFDSKLVYDVTGKGAISSDVFNTGIPNSNPAIINTEVIVPTIYPGDENQQPDPTIQAAEGITSTPAFRNTCYLTYVDLPLASFGNRIPNIRGEISISTALAYLKDTYPGQAPSGLNTLTVPTNTYVDSVNRKAYIVDGATQNIQQINLVADATAPLESWLPSTVYAVGDEILDSNGNVQIVYAINDPGVSTYVDPRNGHTYPAGKGMSGGLQPSNQIVGGFNYEWQPEGDLTGDPTDFAQPFHVDPIIWKNLGVGPEAIVIAAQGVLTPILLAGEVATPGKGSRIAIDPSGNIWQAVLIQVGMGPIFHYLMCYDQTSFLAKFRVLIPDNKTGSSVQSISFATTKNGNFMYAVKSSPGDCTVYIYNLAQISAPPTVVANMCIIPFAGSMDSPIFATVTPTGDMYVGYNPNGLVRVSHYNPLTGAVAQSNDLTAAIGDGTESHLIVVLWNPVDQTLIGIAHSGRLVKIDPVTLTVLAVSNPGDIFINGGGPDEAYFTQNGILPISGLLHGFRNPSGFLYNLCAYDKNLNRVIDTPITNWFVNVETNNGFTPFKPCWHDYDAPTDSLIVTTTLSSTYSSSSYRVYVNRQLVSASDLGTVVLDILTRSGIDPAVVDVSRITGTNVLGFPITRNTSVKSLLGTLCQAYYFDIVETDFKLVCVPRGGAIALSIPEDDLGLQSDQHKIEETIAQENDLPLSVTILYADPALDYQQGKALRQRIKRVKKTKNHSLLEIPLTLTSDFAAQLANRALKTVWQERNSYAFKLWKTQYLVLDPTDIIQFTYEGMPFVARLVKESMGVNLALEINAVSEDASNYITSLTVPGGSGNGFVTKFLNPIGPTLLFIFDIPLLQDTDASPTGSSGYYWGVSSVAEGWPGAAIFASPDGESWNNVGFSNTPLSFGAVFAVLPAPTSPWLWDTVNTITVAMSSGTLSSTTQLNVLNGANAALLGGEVIQFQNAVLNANGTYTLSMLLRGRRGTEWECTQHTTGETFVLLTGTNLQRNVVSTSLIGIPRQYKAVTITQATDTAQIQVVTLEGMDLRPYAPAQLTVTRDGSGNFSISWVRRTRIGGAWLDGSGTVPLSEETEEYNLEVLNASGTILRKVIGITSPTYFYTAANVLADYGAPETLVYIRVYQVSAAVGEGFPVTNTTVGESVLEFGAGADATSINGVPIIGTPTTGQVLEFNGTNWIPANAGGGGSGVRTTVNVTTASLTNGQSQTGTLALAKTLALLGASTNGDVRVQLYETAAYRTADAGRAVGTNPTPGTQNGIVADFVLTSALGTWDFSPPLLGTNRDVTPTDTIYYRVTNLGTTRTITIGLTYLPLET